MVNVPTAVWIDEQGSIVRPAESAGASDGFRFMDRQTFEIPRDAAEVGKRTRPSTSRRSATGSRKATRAATRSRPRKCVDGCAAFPATSRSRRRASDSACG